MSATEGAAASRSAATVGGVLSLLVVVAGTLVLVLVGARPAAAEVYYPDCAAARAAGVSDILRWQPGWRPGLTDGNDGIACRSGRGPASITFVPGPPAESPPPPAELAAGTVDAVMVLIVLGAVAAVLVRRREESRS